MQVRRFVAGLALAGAVIGAWAPSAHAGQVPNQAEIQRNLRELKMQPPAVGVPNVDPDNPQLPNLPYVELPVGLTPALRLLSPASVATCQVAYLGPLGGAVAMTMVLDQLPDGTLPVQPSFLAPAFGPVTTACVIAPFPPYTACKNDKPIVDQSEAVPAPFAALASEIYAVQRIVQYYALNRTPLPGDPQAAVAKSLGCK